MHFKYLISNKFFTLLKVCILQLSKAAHLKKIENLPIFPVDSYKNKCLKNFYSISDTNKWELIMEKKIPDIFCLSKNSKFWFKSDLHLTLLRLFPFDVQNIRLVVRTALHDNSVIISINLNNLDTVLQQPNWLSSPCACASVCLKAACTSTNCSLLKVRIDVCMDVI